MNSPLNILYLHSHDTGRYVQPYGYSVSTPNIQRFAEEGVLFRQAFCVSPTCSPSRAGLLTGEYPHECGMHGLASPAWGYRLRQPGHLLAHVLSEAGYLTALAGIQHLAKAPASDERSLGYQQFLNERDFGEDEPDTHERAARFITQPHDQPWYLSVGLDETHRDSRKGDPSTGTHFSKHHPYDPASLDARYQRGPALFPDTPEIRRDMASYAEGVRRLDERYGVVLDALRQSGQADHTLVILTTDHGLAWPGMKCTLTDHGLGVTLILRGPGGFTGGRVVDSMVTHLDVFPTIMELIDREPPRHLRGRSLLPLIRGEIATLHDRIFAEQGWHEVAEPQRAVRTARHKYIRRLDPVGPKHDNCDEGPAKNLLAPAGWFDRDLGSEQLFDLWLDPLETCNRIDDPALAGVRAGLREALDRWMVDTDDPLLAGEPVPPPARCATAAPV